MEVRVDRDLCEANAVCCGLAPTVFELDDNEELQIKVEQVPAELEARVLKAIDRCPKNALSAH
ncbi:ferredoxin [Rhodococcus sp. D2-41]|uniref:Ferredoxin n=2 Tax=Speluncibacter jeojiensis TaxID=2710754 RepID=A0A9X4M1L4_9ACTN|nr:ferredoxin [Rhodococcus sp. D2-41]MDG3011510.1 ferredoxin [Rhodococcus sp. D2-41]MDG3015134.1 ferredoxin [Corynebacteriales bacterium D3-21]